MTCSHNATVLFKDDSTSWPLIICTKPNQLPWCCQQCLQGDLWSETSALADSSSCYCCSTKDNNSSHPPIRRELKNFLLSIPGSVATFLDKGNGSLHSTPPTTPIPIKWRLNPFRTSNHSNRELIPSGHGMKRNRVPQLLLLDHGSGSLLGKWSIWALIHVMSTEISCHPQYPILPILSNSTNIWWAPTW